MIVIVYIVYYIEQCQKYFEIQLKANTTIANRKR